MEASPHPIATPHLPPFITAPGETDVLMVIMVAVLALATLGFGVLFFRLHSLPEQIAHKSQRLQAELVAVLCLISLFTHMHIFWIAGLILALIEFPDFGTPLNRIAGSAEKLAGLQPGEGLVDVPRAAAAHAHDEAKQTGKETESVPHRAETGISHGGTVALPPRSDVTPPKPRERIHA
jgi:hypothetical protein